MQDRTKDGRPVGAWRNNGLTYSIFADDWPGLNLPPHLLSDDLDAARQTGACTDFSGVSFDIIRRLFAVSPDTMLADVGANYAREARHALPDRPFLLDAYSAASRSRKTMRQERVSLSPMASNMRAAR